MDDNTTTPALPEPRFAVGAAVTVNATGRKGTVVYNARAMANGARWSISRTATEF